MFSDEKLEAAFCYSLSTFFYISLESFFQHYSDVLFLNFLKIFFFFCLNKPGAETILYWKWTQLRRWVVEHQQAEVWLLVAEAFSVGVFLLGKEVLVLCFFSFFWPMSCAFLELLPWVSAVQAIAAQWIPSSSFYCSNFVIHFMEFLHFWQVLITL